MLPSTFRLSSMAAAVSMLAVSTYAADNNKLASYYTLSLEDLGKVEITTATGSSKPLDKAPATATVISAAEIKAMGARDLDEVLERIPGLHVSLSTLSRLDSVYSIRGIHTGFNPHVLLLINGVPVQFSLQGGRPIRFRFPVTSIARLEVIRGPGSAIYGADAYSGVINIITHTPGVEEETQVGSRLGSFSTRDLWVSSTQQLSDWSMSFNMTYQHSDGDTDRRANADLQTNLDAALGSNASNAPGPLETRYEVLDTHLTLSNKNWNVNLWSWNSHDAGVGAGAAQALDPTGHDDNDLYLADATYNTADLFSDWLHSARVSYQYYKTQAQLNVLPSGTTVPIGSDGNVDFVAPAGVINFPDGLIGNPGATTQDSQLDIVSSYTGWEDHRWRIAIGARHQALDTQETKNFGPGVIDGTEGIVDGTLTDVSNTPFVFVRETSRSTRYVSIQDEWHFASNWELTAGVRYDDYSDFGSTVNPRGALVWSTHEKLTTKLLYGSAFRAPSFSEQFNDNNPVSLGRPDLDPEIIDTLELSFNFHLSNELQTTFAVFAYDAEDMIEFVPDTNPDTNELTTTSTAQNARNQKGEGIEWDWSWRPSKTLRLDGSYSQHNARDKDTNLPVPDAPRKQFTLNTQWEFASQWFVHTQLNWVGDRPRAGTDLRPEIDDYTRLDFTLRGENLLPNLDIALAVRNATDEDIREPSNGVIVEDFALEGRSFWAEISYFFR